MASCRLFKKPHYVAAGVAGVLMPLGIIMASTANPLATSLSLKLAMTAGGTASLATGLLTAGIIIAAAGLMLGFVALLLYARMRASSRIYIESEGQESHQDAYSSRRPFVAASVGGDY